MSKRVFASVALAAIVMACGGDGRITAPKAPAGVGGLAAIGTDPTTGATIETSQDDYAPGEIVHVTGRGWAPNETVNLSMSEDPDTHPDVSTDVQADSTGAFSIHFYDVQEYDLGVVFTLTATGRTSGSVAVATFTDGTITAATITMRDGATCTSAQASVPAGTAICAHSSFTISGSGGTNAQIRWKSPTGTIVQIDTRTPQFGNGETGAKTYDATYTPTTAGTWTVLLCESANTDPAPGGVAQCASSSQKASQTFVVTAAPANTAPNLGAIGNKSVDEGSTLTFTASATDGDTPAQTLTYSLVGAPAGTTINSSSGAFSWTPTDGPAQTATFTVKVTDNGSPAMSDEESITVTVNNVKPTATFNAPASVSAGANINLSLTAPFDPSSVDVSAGLTYAFDCGTGSGYGALSATSTAVCPTSAPGSRTVKGKIHDKDGGETEYTASVAIDNVPPTANAGGSYSGNEGSSITITGTGNDPDGGTVTYLWSVAPNDGHCNIASATSPSTSVTCNDNGSWTLTLKVTDDETAFTTSDATLTVANVAPTIGGLTAPSTVNEGQNIVFSVTSVSDPSSADVAAGFTYAFSCDGTTPASFSSTNSKTCATTDNGTVTIKAVVKDKDGAASTTASQTVTVENVDPTATFNAPSAVDEGSPINLSLTNPLDPSSADVAAGFTYAFDCGSGYGAFSATSTASCSTNDNGSRAVKAKIKDKDGGFTEYSASVTINNVAPTATFNAPASVDEGSPFNLSLTGPFDPSSVDVAAGLQYAFDCGDGSGYTSYGATTSKSCATSDNATRTVHGKIRDKDGGETVYSGSVVVNNVAPSITSLTIPLVPIAAGLNNVTVTWTFDDPGSDMWTCEISWNTGLAYEAGTVSGKTCSATTTLGAGIYTVTAKVSDDDGGSDTETATAYIVVYDPSAGFVTGGGWITSPTGAYVPNPSLTGKATFGFVSKYKKGQSTPDGSTEFQFHAAGMNFKSTVYEWLVVSGARAQFKGTGTINGAGNYGFLLTAIDGQVSGGGGTDKFRIKIWDIATSAIVYDNNMSATDTADPTTTLGGGSINIQAK